MILTAGQVHESTQASILIEGLTLISLIADKGYDNDAFRADLAAAEVDVVIPPLGSRTAENRLRQKRLRLALPDRMLHQQNQALSQGSNPLRKNGAQLSLDGRPRRRYGLASGPCLNVNRP
jgi:transposase